MYYDDVLTAVSTKKVEHVRKFKILKLIIFAAAVFGLGFFVFSAKVQAYQHPGGFHKSEQLEYTRNQIVAGAQPWTTAYSKLMQKATTALSHTPSAPSYYYVPGFYVDPDAHNAAKKVLNEDANAAYASALAYALNANLSSSVRDNYGKKAIQILNNWSYNHKTTGGDDGALTLAYTGNELVRAGELMLGSSLWSALDQAQFVKWANAIVYPPCRNIANRKNNWATWGILCSLAINHATENQTRMTADIERLKAIIDEQIEPDGSMPEELKRGSSAAWYTYFALNSMTGAAEIAKNSGVNLYDYQPPSGGTVKDALDYLWSWGSTYTTDSNSYGRELYEAMGRIYNDSGWKNWASESIVYMAGTGRSWIIPALTRPEQLFSADVDGSGIVNIKDIQACVKVIAKSDLTYEAKCQAVAPPIDVVNIKDIQAIIREIIK